MQFSVKPSGFADNLLTTCAEELHENSILWHMQAAESGHGKTFTSIEIKPMSTFDKVSGQYQRKSLVQQAAAEKLIALLNIGNKNDVLDVACGPGHITQRIKELTQGRVVGTDISAGMIGQAQAQYPNCEFRKLAAEDLDYREEFDLVFCNSSFQWFTMPAEAVVAMRAALRPGGRVGVSCPATEQWSVCFKSVAEEAGTQPDVRSTFARWKSPWFFPRILVFANLASLLFKSGVEIDNGW